MPETIAKKYIGNLEKIKRDLPNQAYRIIAELQDKIIPYITERQLFDKGIDGKGKKLKPYSPFTIALKKQKGEVYNRTTLLDTGDFYDGFYLFAKDEKIEVASSDKKADELKAKYGKDIFVFTVNHNKEINNELLLPRLIEWVLSQIKI